jgi:hypothetical protein
VKNDAIRFIVLMGIVSLLADFTYEGARSITGPFLAILGASGAAVGVIVGLGELAGYSVRVFSGYAADKTRAYWTFTFIGYAIIPNSSENFTFELRQSPGVERS